jgi:cytochrome P450
MSIEEFLADPFGTLKRVRAAGPVADFGGSADGAVGNLLGVVSHAGVRELLADARLHANFPDFLKSFGVTSGVFFDWMAMSPLNRDGEEHRRWRGVMTRAFTPRRVEGIRDFLRDAARELVAAFAPRGRCEFMADFADQYPSLGLCELIGVPKEDRDRFRGWANTIGLGFSPLVLAARIGEVDEALTQLLAYTGDLAERRRAEPRDDLVSRIAQAADEDGGWTEAEVEGAIAGLVFAGHETTKNQLGWMVAVLAERRDVWDAVAAGTLEVAAVVEEVMRFRSAATAVGRTVVEPVDVEGERLEPGDRVFLSLWGADHDERAFPKPETIDPVGNAEVPHIAFGYGAHHCLGAALARAELQEGLAALTRAIECPRIEEGAIWKPPLGINGPERLPIAFAPRYTD